MLLYTAAVYFQSRLICTESRSWSWNVVPHKSTTTHTEYVRRHTTKPKVQSQLESRNSCAEMYARWTQKSCLTQGVLCQGGYSPTVRATHLARMLMTRAVRSVMTRAVRSVMTHAVRSVMTRAVRSVMTHVVWSVMTHAVWSVMQVTLTWYWLTTSCR